MSMTPRNEIQIRVLALQLKILEDDSAELFGFWYYKEDQIPHTREEKRLLEEDLKTGSCRKLLLKGSLFQIENILLSAEWNPRITETSFPTIEKAIKMARDFRGIGVGFDNLLKPKGTALPIKITVQMNGDVDSVIGNIDPQKDEITIILAEDWKAQWTGGSVLNAWWN